MSKKKARVNAPLPKAEALVAGQQQENSQTLAQNLAANRVNQVTPYGNITYSGDPLTGQTQTTTLTEGAQSTLNNQESLAKLLSGLGIQAGGNINLSQPDLAALPSRVNSLDTSGLPALPGAEGQEAERARIEKSLFDRSTSLLRPEFDQQRSRTTQTLADRGFDLERSAGAQSEFDRLDRSQNASYERAAADAVAGGGAEMSRNYGIASDARSRGLAEQLANAGLSNEGRDAGLNEQLTMRNLPLQDISALNSLTPNLPTLAPTSPYTSTQAPTDVAGTSLAAYQAALNKAQLDQQAKSSFWNNITGLATAGAAAASDRRLKTAVRKIGRYRGLNLYTWRWNARAKELFGKTGADAGVMAQEVREMAPHAVIVLPSGYLAVDYHALSKA